MHSKGPWSMASFKCRKPSGPVSACDLAWGFFLPAQRTALFKPPPPLDGRFPAAGEEKRGWRKLVPPSPAWANDTVSPFSSRPGPTRSTHGESRAEGGGPGTRVQGGSLNSRPRSLIRVPRPDTGWER